MRPNGQRTKYCWARSPRCGRSAATSSARCGSVPVIAAAETLVKATSDLDLNEKNGARFQRKAEAVVTAQEAFLDVCREDLAYTVRWYQVLRRRKERRFLREKTER